MMLCPVWAILGDDAVNFILALTSMLRVGSVHDERPGQHSFQRATSTFCWLPPTAIEFSFGGRRLDRQLGDIIPHELLILLSSIRCRRIRYLFSDATETLSAMESTPGCRCSAAVLGQHGDAVLMASCGWLTVSSVSSIVYRVAAQTEQTLHQLGTLAPTRPATPRISPLRTPGSDVTEALIDGR